MSKIAITPNVSGTGTFTIAAPNSDTDRTLTLPDAAGAVVIDEAGGGSVKIDSSGNVGIGTSSPQYKVNINNTDTSTDFTANPLLVLTNDQYTVGTGATLGFGFTSNTIGAAITGRSAQSGAGGYLTFETRDNFGTVGERMRIDGAGRVTTPYQPAFLAYNAPASLVAGSTIVWSSTALNRGSVYNTSNGRFTAPVSGLYQFFASVRVESGIANTSYHRLTFLHNGSQIQWSLSRLNFHLNGYFSHASNDQVVAMSAGDYVEVKFESSPSPITTGAPNEHIFYGYLIG